jgi:CHRD domain
MVLKRRYVLVAAMIAGLAAGSYAVASKGFGPLHHRDPPNTKNFHARLNGYQEVSTTPNTAPVSSTGVGEFRAKLVAPDKLHYVFRYSGLEGGASLFAHVHFGQRGVAGGVSFFLCGGSTKPTPCPNVSGTVEGDVGPADVIGPNGQGIEPGSFGEIIKAMQAGVAYANIHTTRWPGGEIRGQINDRNQRQFEG